jgi:hypothetical protein
MGAYVTAPRDASSRVLTGFASAKQVEFVTSLLEKKVVPADAAERLRARVASGLLGKQEASQAIDWLLKQPAKPRATSPRPSELPEVPAGRYAIEVPGGEETDGEPVLRFFKVDRPEAPSRWAGYTFVKQLAGPEEWPVRGQRAKDVLAKIAEAPAEASARYGHEIGECGICGRRLTDAESRARGIGPICANRVGW